MAFAIAFLPQNNSSHDRMEYHSTRASRALRAKIINNAIDEADLYATLLLTVLSCVHFDIPKFMIHLNGFMAILKELTRKASNDGQVSDLSKLGPLSSAFLPLARDLILETSRRLNDVNVNDLVIEFSYSSQFTIGSPTFQRRVQYNIELLGADPNNCLSFCTATWHHFTVLRRCFRHVVFQQIEERRPEFSVQILVSEIKADLQSHNIQEVVARMLALKYNPSAFILPTHSSYDLFTFNLLLYHFCSLLIIMLEANTVTQGAISIEATSLATLILPHIEDRWLGRNTYDPALVPGGFHRAVLIRVLYVLGFDYQSKTVSRS